MTSHFETVTRFPEGADQNVKAQFAKDLVAALEKCEVKPGQAFEVMSSKSLGDLERDHEATVKALDEELEVAKGRGDDYSSLVELVTDVQRGIRTVDELYEYVRDE